MVEVAAFSHATCGVMPRVALKNAACGDANPRTRKLQSPRAAFEIPPWGVKIRASIYFQRISQKRTFFVNLQTETNKHKS